jgi:hypothetical protein
MIHVFRVDERARESPQQTSELETCRESHSQKEDAVDAAMVVVVGRNRIAG